MYHVPISSARDVSAAPSVLPCALRPPFALKLKPTTPGVSHERRSAPWTAKLTAEKYEASGWALAESVIVPDEATSTGTDATKAVLTAISTPSATERMIFAPDDAAIRALSAETVVLALTVIVSTSDGNAYSRISASLNVEPKTAIFEIVHPVAGERFVEFFSNFPPSEKPL